MLTLLVRIYCFSLALIAATTQVHAQPVVDHHQHLFSPRIAELSPGSSAITASDVVDLLDAAGIQRALVLSVAYQFGNPNRPAVADEYAKVRAENDWVGQEVERFPNRLRGFCGFSPLKEYAFEELRRCAENTQLRSGIKLHFGNSDVDLDDAKQVERLRAIFRSANDHHMAVAVHLHPSVNMRRSFGARQARTFLNDVISAAPDVPIQIAHLGGAGGYDTTVDEALAVFVDAIAAGDTRMANVYFDVSGVAGIGEWTESKAAQVAMRLRQLGLRRVVYGSDAAVPTNTPREAWEKFKSIPLSDSEFKGIESNIAPYMR